MKTRITRRTVIKGLTASIGLALLPVNLMKTEQEKIKARFKPMCEYGRGVQFEALDLEKEHLRIASKHLRKDLKRFLPTGTPFEIRAMKEGKNKCIYFWYYSPRMTKTTFNNHGWKWNASGREAFVWGRFLA
jgi:hypothetical protein